MFHNSDSTHSSHALFLTITLLLTLSFAALPAFATEPEVIDPDPDQLTQMITSEPTQVLVLSDLADLEIPLLTPGRYLVWIVVDDDGRREAIIETILVIEVGR